MFLFDPTQDPRFRIWMEGSKPNYTRIEMVGRQDTFLIETINRICRLTGLAQTQRTKRPLIVVVTKYDTWGHKAPTDFVMDPWREKNGKTGLEIGVIEKRSEELRKLLRQLTPEVVGAADSISEKVTYIPVSALGQTPARDANTNKAMIRPLDIRPIGVVTPMLYGLFQSSVSLIQVLRSKSERKAAGGVK